MPCMLRAALQTTEDVGVWLQAFAVATNTHWNVRKTYPSATNFLLRKDFGADVLFIHFLTTTHIVQRRLLL